MNRALRTLCFNLVVVLLLLTACQPVQPEGATAPEGATEEHEAAGHVAHWGYEGEGGPEHWGMLSDINILCGTGTEQSPIDLTAAAGEDLPDISFNYSPATLIILNNGHTVQVSYAPGSTIEVNGVTYELKQFHFHGHSEHTIDGVAYPLEMHLVHATPEGNLAVVGVMIDAGEENAAFASIWENAPVEATAVITVEGTMINARELLPAAGTYYGYPGSLTTPPCSEGVKWHVLTTPIQMSQAQIDAMSEILHGNYRPVQPLNERELAVDTESAATQ